MAVGLPLKTTYADGDVYSASDVNDTNGTINAYLAPSLGFAAGKNKIINGDFYINQRNFTSNTSTGSYGFDRWAQLNSGGTVTVTPQTFTAGSAPVAGYEGANFARIVSASQSASTNYASLIQRIENVRTLAGQTATISFWAKASTGTPKIGITLEQAFGATGSATVTTAITAQTITASWVRYSFNVTVPSISGKTVSGGSDSLNILIFTSCGSSISGYSTDVGVQNVTVDFWGVQVENGSTATPFQTATGTIQGELAACQRYYYRNANGAIYSPYGLGISVSGTQAAIMIQNPVTMRVAPTSVDYSTLGITDQVNYQLAVTSIAITYSSPQLVAINAITGSGQTSLRPANLTNQNSTAGFLGFSAEL
jgi:hypothetical protein